MFDEIEQVDGYVYNPYAAKVNGEWVEGETSLNYLIRKYGEFKTVDELITNAESDGFKKFFEYLKNKGILN